MRDGVLIDTLKNVDIVEVSKCGGVNLLVFEGFFRHSLEYNPYTVFVADMFEKRHFIKSQGKDLLHSLVKKIGLTVYGGSTRKDVNEENKCVTENWMRENFDDRVKEWFSVKNGNLIVILQNDESVDGYAKAKSVKTIKSHFGSFILSHSEKLKNEVSNQIGGFHNKSIC